VVRQVEPLQFFGAIYLVEFSNRAPGVMETVEFRQSSFAETSGPTACCRGPFRELKNEDRILSLECA
jgi:hypothetical protein